MTYARLKQSLTKGAVDKVDLKEISNDEFTQLAPLLDMTKNRETLTSIDASNSELDSASLNKLSTISVKCPKLKILNLSSSQISKVSAPRLEELVSERKELKLELSETPLKEELFKEKLDSMKDYPALSKYLQLKMPKVTEAKDNDESEEEQQVVEDDWVQVKAM